MEGEQDWREGGMDARGMQGRDYLGSGRFHMRVD